MLYFEKIYINININTIHVTFSSRKTEIVFPHKTYSNNIYFYFTFFGILFIGC